MGTLIPRRPGPRLVVRVTLFVPTFSRSGLPVDFIVDTGASHSLLHPRDALAVVGISATTLATPQHWPRHVPHQGIGGTTPYFREAAYFVFHHNDGRWHPVAGEIDIARSRPDNQDLPSIIGWDVLQQFRLTLDWPRRQLTFE